MKTKIKLLCLLYLNICLVVNGQTITPGGGPAKFGIDADLNSDTFAFGTSMPAPAGYDDWFKKAGGTGMGIIGIKIIQIYPGTKTNS